MRPKPSSSQSRDEVTDLLRPWLRRGADLFGQRTRRLRALPGLLIAGGQRCGTTSMYKALVQQPTIYRPVWRKGVHYFDVAYDRDIDWYRGHFPLRAQLERSSRRHGTRALCFESSPYYLFHPLAGQRIAATLPDVKMLILVRDPVERAYSAHAHELARGFENLPFEAALEAEAGRLEGEERRLREDPGYESTAHRHQAYRQRGEYAPQVARMASLLGRSQVKVVDSHRFFETPGPVYSDVLDWLGVTEVRAPVFDKYNGRPRLEMSAHVRRALDEHFVSFDQQLTPWLGHEPELASMSPAPGSSASGEHGDHVRVLFLGGLGRSGTTVLERLLDREPEIQALGEVVHLWQRSVRDNELCGCGDPFHDCPFWSAVGQLAFGGWDKVDVDRVLHLRDRVDRSKRVPKLVSGLTSDAWRTDLSEYVSYYERLYSAAREVSGCEVVLDSSKQASLPFCLSSSERIDLRVLHCVRDSRAVAFSQGKQVERPESTSDESRHMHRLKPGGAAFYWMLHNVEMDFYAARFGPTSRLRYEDWVEDPGQALTGIRRFAGLPLLSPRTATGNERLSEVTLAESHTCSGNPMRFTRGAVALRNDDRWRRDLRRRDAVVVTSLTWPLLRRYGYPLASGDRHTAA